MTRGKKEHTLKKCWYLYAFYFMTFIYVKPSKAVEQSALWIVNRGETEICIARAKDRIINALCMLHFV